MPLSFFLWYLMKFESDFRVPFLGSKHLGYDRIRNENTATVCFHEYLFEAFAFEWWHFLPCQFVAPGNRNKKTKMSITKHIKL